MIRFKVRLERGWALQVALHHLPGRVGRSGAGVVSHALGDQYAQRLRHAGDAGLAASEMLNAMNWEWEN